MNLCPLLIIANQSSHPKTKIAENNIKCHGDNCSWYDHKEERCKLINSIYKKDYIMKSFNFI